MANLQPENRNKKLLGLNLNRFYLLKMSGQLEPFEYLGERFAIVDPAFIQLANNEHLSADYISGHVQCIDQIGHTPQATVHPKRLRSTLPGKWGFLK